MIIPGKVSEDGAPICGGVFLSLCYRLRFSRPRGDVKWKMKTWRLKKNDMTDDDTEAHTAATLQVHRRIVHAAHVHPPD